MTGNNSENHLEACTNQSTSRYNTIKTAPGKLSSTSTVSNDLYVDSNICINPWIPDSPVSINQTLTNINDSIQIIQDRLAILVPDPVKLKKYEALQLAYDQYKMLESLLYEENK